MTKIHFNTAFEKMTKNDLENWKKLNYNKLIGSAVFTKNNSLVSRIVSYFEKKSHKQHTMFSPSHVGSIIEYNNDLYIFNMKPLKASVIPLTKYIYDTSDDFVLMFRNFKLDTNMFSKILADYIGQPYPYLSAIMSVFSKRESKWRRHCSELHARTLKLCGFPFKDDFNFECTPLELYKYLISSEIYK